MKPTNRAALLADVAAICIESMQYDAAQLPRSYNAEYIDRIIFLSSDARLYTTYPRDRQALIKDVMKKYSVSNAGARRIIRQAREYDKRKTQTPPLSNLADAL